MPNSPNYELALQTLKNEGATSAIPLFAESFRRREPLAEKSLLFALMFLDQLNDVGESIKLLKQAIEILPAKRDRWLVVLAQRYMSAGDQHRALEHLEQGIAANPGEGYPYLLRAIWRGRQMGDCKESRELYESWAQRFMDPLTDAAEPLTPRTRSPGQRIKLGYVSGDFKNHSVRYFIEPYLRHHDRNRFEVHAFMTMPGDEVTEWIKPLPDHWHDVASKSDQDLVRYIRALEIDILVDLSGHTDGNRLEVFARRAAPVQVTWFGFMPTLGMKAIDWRLTDHTTISPAMEACYTERVYRLDCMSAYAPPLHCEEQFDSPWTKNGYVTMICLNHSRKISDESIALWSEILNRTSNSGLIVISSLADENKTDTVMTDRLSAAGMPMGRVTIVNRLPMAVFMRLASVADFALDPIPGSGGTTTLHAMWMGLPTLTIDRRAIGAEQGAAASIQAGCGLPDPIVRSKEEYVDTAVAWINDPGVISEIRARCRLGLEQSQMMKHQERIDELEKAYEEIFQRSQLHHALIKPN